MRHAIVGKWKHHFEEHGAKVFGGKEKIKTYKKKRANLKRIVGKKQVEIALLKHLGRALTVDEKVDLASDDSPDTC